MWYELFTEYPIAYANARDTDHHLWLFKLWKQHDLTTCIWIHLNKWCKTDKDRLWFATAPNICMEKHSYEFIFEYFFLACIHFSYRKWKYNFQRAFHSVSVQSVVSFARSALALKYHMNKDILIAIDSKYLMKCEMSNALNWDSVKPFRTRKHTHTTICKWWLCVFFLALSSHSICWCFSVNTQHYLDIWFIELWLLLQH